MEGVRGEAAFNGLSFNSGGGGVDLPWPLVGILCRVWRTFNSAVLAKIFEQEELAGVDQTAIQVFCRNLPPETLCIYPAQQLAFKIPLKFRCFT